MASEMIVALENGASHTAPWGQQLKKGKPLTVMSDDPHLGYWERLRPRVSVQPVENVRKRHKTAEAVAGSRGRRKKATATVEAKEPEVAKAPPAPEPPLSPPAEEKAPATDPVAEEEASLRPRRRRRE